MEPNGHKVEKQQNGDRLLQIDIAGVYNVAGGNRGLAEALAELQHVHRPVYITHELNRLTEPLLRTQQLIT